MVHLVGASLSRRRSRATKRTSPVGRALPSLIAYWVGRWSSHASHDGGDGGLLVLRVPLFWGPSPKRELLMAALYLKKIEREIPHTYECMSRWRPLVESSAGSPYRALTSYWNIEQRKSFMHA